MLCQHACQLTCGLWWPHKLGLISLQHFPLLLSLASGLSICYSHHSAHYSLSPTPPPFRCGYFARLSLKCHTPSPFFSLSSPAHHLWPASLPPIIFSTAVFALCLGSPGCNLDNHMKNNRNSREESASGSPRTVRSHYSSCDCDVSLYSARQRCSNDGNDDSGAFFRRRLY